MYYYYLEKYGTKYIRDKKIKNKNNSKAQFVLCDYYFILQNM